MRPIIYPYKMGSKSAKALAESLRDLRSLRVRENGRYRPFRNHLIINWGNPRVPTWAPYMWEGMVQRVFNKPHLVAVAQDKLKTYQLLEGHCNIPEFTTDIGVCSTWPEKYLARTVLHGHGGVGIQWCQPQVRPVQAPLYVKYMKKRYEYRVHVFNDKIICIQMKRKRNGVEDANMQIRNHDNGWVFCHNNIVEPHNQVLEQARLAVRRIGLHFGAVDIGWNERHQLATIYEVNTAPGLEGTTLTQYSNAIREIL